MQRSDLRPKGRKPHNTIVVRGTHKPPHLRAQPNQVIVDTITRPELKIELVQGGQEELARLTEGLCGEMAEGQAAACDEAWALLGKGRAAPQATSPEEEEGAVEGEEEGVAAGAGAQGAGAPEEGDEGTSDGECIEEGRDEGWGGEEEAADEHGGGAPEAAASAAPTLGSSGAALSLRATCPRADHAHTHAPTHTRTHTHTHTPHTRRRIRRTRVLDAHARPQPTRRSQAAARCRSGCSSTRRRAKRQNRCPTGSGHGAVGPPASTTTRA
jgi:hypothetical protein